MNRPTLLNIAIPLGLGLLAQIGCGPSGGDDDDDTTPPAASASQIDATPTAGPVNVTGEIRVIDTAGNLVEPEMYDKCFGPIALYLLDDPTRLDEPVDKRILSQPGSFDFILPPKSTGHYLTVMADTWANNMLDFRDFFVEYPKNPVSTDVADMDLAPIDVVVTLCDNDCCVGGGGDATYSSYSGTIIQDTSVPVFPILVTANNTDFTGPYSGDLLYEPGSFLMYLNEAYLEKTNLLAILDIDNNGLFEPADHLGVAENNPYDVGGEQSFENIKINIDERSVKLDAPYLPVYVPVTGTILYEGEEPQGLFMVHVSKERPRGPLVSEGALPEADPFLLRAPQHTTGLWLWGVVDVNGDGVGDPATEPWGKTGPFNTTSAGVFGLELHLGAEPPVTPSPEETEAPEPTDEPAPTAAPTATAPQTTPMDGGTHEPVTEPPVLPTATPATPVPTPTIPLAEQRCSVAGTVSFSGSVTEQDYLVISVGEVTSGGGDEGKVVRIPITLDGFPIEYSVTGLTAGTYQILAYVDIGGNNEDGPGQEDAPGWYTGTDSQGAPAQVVLGGGDDMTGLNFTIFE